MPLAAALATATASGLLGLLGLALLMMLLVAGGRAVLGFLLALVLLICLLLLLLLLLLGVGRRRAHALVGRGGHVAVGCGRVCGCCDCE